MSPTKFPSQSRTGFSLLELLAIVTILGVIAALVIPRISNSSVASKAAADRHNRSEINSATERWFTETSTWPKSDLSDIGAHPKYFPDGIPTNPTDGSAYELDNASHRVK